MTILDEATHKKGDLIGQKYEGYNSGDTLLIFSPSFNIKLNMTPLNSKTASKFSEVSPEYQYRIPNTGVEGLVMTSLSIF